MYRRGGDILLSNCGEIFRRKICFNCSSSNIHSYEYLMIKSVWSQSVSLHKRIRTSYHSKVWLQLVEGCAPVVELHLKAVWHFPSRLEDHPLFFHCRIKWRTSKRDIERSVSRKDSLVIHKLPTAHTHTRTKIPSETAPEFSLTVLFKSYF